MCKRINLFFPCLLGGYFGLSLVVSYILSFADISMPFWLQLVVSQTILLIPAVIYCIVMKINVMKAIPYRKIKPVDALLSILIGYMLVPIVLFINNITMLFSTNHIEAETPEITSYPFLIQILLLAVIPPIVEEFVFRGLFYHSYRKNGILGAALASGIVFGIGHLNINQFCYTFLMGIVLALLVEATGSMFSGMLAHFSFNTYSIIMLKLLEIANVSTETVVEETEEISQTAMIVSRIIGILFLGVIGAAFVILVFLLILSMAKRNGKKEYLKYNLKLGLKARNHEKFFDASYIITAVVAFLYMIMSELLIWLQSA